MRRLISLILVLLCLASPVLAETDSPAEQNTYIHSVLGYSLTPPEGWLLLDESIVTSMLNDLSEGEGVISDQQLRSFYAQLNGTLVTIAFLQDGSLNLVIGPEDFGVDADIETLTPAILASLSASLSSFNRLTWTDSGSIVTFGNTDFLRIAVSYEIQGQPMSAVQYIAAHDGIGYYLVFTSGGGEAAPLSMDEIEEAAIPFLESFSPPEAREKVTVPYTHADHGYGMSIPEDWLVIDRESIITILDQVEKDEFTFADPRMPAQWAARLKDHNIMMAIKTGGMANINVVTEPAGAEEDIHSLAPFYKKAVQNNFSAYDDVEFQDSGSIICIGETEFLRVSARLKSNSIPMHISQYIACKNGTVYCITLTCNASAFTTDIMEAIARPFLESFRMPEA